MIKYSVILYILSSWTHAMYGDLLPLDLAPAHACKVSFLISGATCSGVIVDKKILKTAAHCLRHKKAENIKVTCPNGQSMTAQAIVAHPQYDSLENKMLADIGFIYLNENFRGKTSKVAYKKEALKKLLEKSSLCAVWSYGHNIKNIRDLGFFHGVAITDYDMSESHIVLPNYDQVMIRSGDSGGGLYCLDAEDEWINIATVYGHDFESSYLLRNDYVEDFFISHNIKSKTVVEPSAKFEFIETDPINIEKGKIYRVKAFSRFKDLNDNIYGNGDQIQVYFKVDDITTFGIHGELRIDDLFPSRYLCDDIIICHGVYKNLIISRDRLIGLE